MQVCLVLKISCTGCLMPSGQETEWVHSTPPDPHRGVYKWEYSTNFRWS